MSPQANKSSLKSYCSNKISHNLKQEGYIFNSVLGILDIYCHLLPGFSVKFAYQNFTDVMSSEAIAVDN